MPTCLQSASDPVLIVNPLESFLLRIFHCVGVFLISWALRLYLATYIILIYMSLNAYAKHMPGVHEVGTTRITSSSDIQTKCNAIIVISYYPYLLARPYPSSDLLLTCSGPVTTVPCSCSESQVGCSIKPPY